MCFYNFIVKPVADFEIAAGMKSFELEADVGEASAKSCSGCSRDPFGLVSKVRL